MPQDKLYDVVIVGGGINGAGIAAEAAQRGLKVFLCEQNDFASATSSASSKLIHGGLRYLEQYHFRLVREALVEREILYKKAPHLVRPLQFIMPHQSRLRPAWLIRIGLFLYDYLGTRELLPRSQHIYFNADDTNNPLKSLFKQGFSYYDCFTDDARLVIANLQTAHNYGASVHNYTQCQGVKCEENTWSLQLQDKIKSQTYSVQGRVLINATGPWAQSFLEKNVGLASPYSMRLIRGSHIIVPALYSGDQAYILQNTDGRVIFVIPYLQRFSLIGTTDQDHNLSPDAGNTTSEEILYLIKATNIYFKNRVKPEDVVATYWGVRPLYGNQTDAAQKVSRDYLLYLSKHTAAPLLSIFGGKLTTYRRLAEKAVNALTGYFPSMSTVDTLATPLAGGNMATVQQLIKQLRQDYAWLPQALLQRYAESYGTLTYQLLENCQSLQDMGHHFGAQLYTREIDYLKQQEWALYPEDILWRRTKLGLFLTADEKKHFSAAVAA